MKKFLFALTLISFVAAACGSGKEAPNHKKVDKSYEDFKKRNPDSE
jgi:hypothetical protein